MIPDQVTVATSDGLEQVIILGQGGHRMSARDLKEEIFQMEQEIRENYLGRTNSPRNYLERLSIVSMRCSFWDHR